MLEISFAISTIFFVYSIEHIEKCWTGDQRLKTHIHEAIDVGISQTLVDLVEVGHRELEIIR